jgi:hypothetical protein
MRLSLLVAAIACQALGSAHAEPAPGATAAPSTGLTGMWLKEASLSARPPMPLTPLAQAAQDKARAELAAGHVIS